MAIASIADFREDDSKSPPLARPCVGTPLGELSGCRRDGPGARLDDPFLGRRALRFENLAAAERFDSLIPTAKKILGALTWRVKDLSTEKKFSTSNKRCLTRHFLPLTLPTRVYRENVLFKTATRMQGKPFLFLPHGLSLTDYNEPQPSAHDTGALDSVRVAVVAAAANGHASSLLSYRLHRCRLRDAAQNVLRASNNL